MNQLFSSAIGVEATLYLLLLFSVATWALLLIKGVQHARVSRSNARYARQFWQARDLQSAAAIASAAPFARVAKAGLIGLGHADQRGYDLEHSGDRQDLLERHLRQQIHKERRALESGLAVLASIGSTAPFIGLFGTVWGIMHALKAISASGSASLDVVAGPIGEALIATAIGIAVAVPAVLAFNFFQRRNRAVGADLDDFATDFITLSQATAFRHPGSAATPATSANDNPAAKPAATDIHIRKAVLS
ncbi:MotA/TolQ/ExbB proton channel family protein [Herbaspirillum autotrophicum]|uniref:MotA/TolQ/ExbB proton channel family protein n=1 Tax=Herbaspirillum autotrophicum TaxID=180195 RepID=UPI00067D4EAA|nr:MotA/TolQ/ExbB proton channel family protein [Herbaspirillum autotrophicum]